jgi:hypothetical protein
LVAQTVFDAGNLRRSHGLHQSQEVIVRHDPTRQGQRLGRRLRRRGRPG